MHFDLFFSRKAFLRLGDGRFRFRHAEPLLVLAEPHLDVADALEILVELVGVGLREAALQVARIGEHGIEHAALLREHRLALRSAALCHLRTGDGTPAPDSRSLPSACRGVPRERQTGTVSRVRHIRRVELDRGKACFLTEMCRCHLVGGDTVVKALSRLRKTVRACQPERAAPMRFVRELVRTTLHNRDVLLMSRQRLEPVRQFPRRACFALSGNHDSFVTPQPKLRNTIASAAGRLRGSERFEADGFKAGRAMSAPALRRKWRRVCMVFVLIGVMMFRGNYLV